MLTKKNFEAIAEIMSNARDFAKCGPLTPEQTIELVEDGLTAYFSADNYRFDINRFHAASGRDMSPDM